MYGIHLLGAAKNVLKAGIQADLLRAKKDETATTTKGENKNE